MVTLEELQSLMEEERAGDPECATIDSAWELLLEWEEYGEAITAERDRLAADLAAANATLDRLREVGEDWIREGESLEGSYDAMTRMYAILNLETTSIRDTAAAHRFDAMPDDIAQRSVDGETNYVRLDQENTHADHD